MIRFRAAATLFVSLAAGCTAVQNENGQPPDEVLYAAGQQVGRCNFKSHMQCIYLTASETIADGRQVKWTRHWFRMSYIGRACEEQHGKTTGIVLESLFAIPHYLGVGIGNTLSVLLYPLGPIEQDDTQVMTLGVENSGTEPTQDHASGNDTRSVDQEAIDTGEMPQVGGKPARSSTDAIGAWIDELDPLDPNFYD